MNSAKRYLPRIPTRFQMALHVQSAARSYGIQTRCLYYALILQERVFIVSNATLGGQGSHKAFLKETNANKSYNEHPHVD